MAQMQRNAKVATQASRQYLSRLKRANAWTQWGKLKEVMVGCADFACYPHEQPALRPTLWNTTDEDCPADKKYPRGRHRQDHIDRANKQLDNLADVLMGEGISVVRPSPIDWSANIQTPFWSAPSQNCTVCPRDTVATIGNVIVESAMSRRDRYFEKYAYRDLIEDLYENDDKMHWVSGPQGSMNDNTYDTNYWNLTDEDLTAEQLFRITENYIAFDVADITKCGKDIFIQPSNVTNYKGIKWLKRELSNFGIRVHIVRFPGDIAPWHLDATFVPLRPGLVMVNPRMGPIIEEDWKIFERNGWKKVIGQTTVLKEMPSLCQCGLNLNFNILVVDDETVVCEETEIPTHQFLKNACGFKNIVTVPFKHVYQFGGAIHCATWDIFREDECEDFFPNQ